MADSPRILKDFRIYFNGFDMAANCEEVTPPVIEYATETMNMGYFEREITMGLKAMSMELTVSSVTWETWLSIGAQNLLSGNLVVLRGYEDDDMGNSSSISISVIGKVKKVDRGSLARSKKGSVKIELSISQYTELLNDIPFTVIDPITNTLIIAGISQLDKANKALGI